MNKQCSGHYDSGPLLVALLHVCRPPRLQNGHHALTQTTLDASEQFCDHAPGQTVSAQLVHSSVLRLYLLVGC